MRLVTESGVYEAQAVCRLKNPLNGKRVTLAELGGNPWSEVLVLVPGRPERWVYGNLEGARSQWVDRGYRSADDLG